MILIITIVRRGHSWLGADWVQEELMSRGFRLTEQRAAVLRTAADFPGSFDAHELWIRARHKTAGLGIATVYRTLDLLVKAGAVERVHGRENCESFVVAGKEHKHRVVCRHCGATSELPEWDCEGFLADAARHTGFRIDDHLIQLDGLCPDCKGSQS